MAAVDGERKPRGGKEFNWAVKYQPKTLKDFIICHRDIAEKLETSVRNGVGDHFIIEGPPGVGKRTLALAMLREKLGVDILETRLEFKTFIMENASKGGLCSSIQFPVQVSSEHKELNLSGLKEYAADGVLMLIEKVETGLVKQQSLHQHQVNVKAIIFHKAENVSKHTQLHIRSFLENCGGHYVIIFCCYDILKLQNLSPLRRVIGLHPPPDTEIIEVLNLIAKQEDIQLPHQLAQTMAQMSMNCLQQAIRSFEATWQSGYPFKEDQLIVTGWEDEITSMAQSIIQEQSPGRLFLVRIKLMNLIEHNPCAQFIFSGLVGELMNTVDDGLKLDIGSFCQEFALVGDYYEERNIISFQDKTLDNREKKKLPHFLW